MKKLALFISYVLVALGSVESQDILPFGEVPDSLNPFFNEAFDLIAIADLNNDGFDDVLFGSYNSIDNNFGFFHHLYKGEENGSFSLLDAVDSPFQPIDNYLGSAYSSSEDYVSLSFADFDSDEDMDIILDWLYWNYDGTYSSLVYIITNNGDGSFNVNPDEFVELQAYTNGIYTPHFFDTDLDNQIEVIMGSNSFVVPQYELLVFNEDFNTFLSEGFPAGLEIFQRPFYDLNNDGYSDIIGYDSFKINNGVDLDLDGIADFTTVDAIFPFNQSFVRTEIGNFGNDEFIDVLVFDQYSGHYRLFSQDCNISNGSPCNDLNECTINEYWSDCACIGGQELPDSDADGICDEIDETNGDCELYESCNDGILCTVNDSLDENCNCVGEDLPDDDGDGICNELDQCPEKNDTVDNNLNGIPDCLEIQNEADFEEYDDGIIGPNPNPSDQKSLLEKQIQIFPNPSTGIFTIESNLKIEKLKLFNSIGEELPLFISGQNQVDLSHFSNGIYFLELKTEEGFLRKKLIKE